MDDTQPQSRQVEGRRALPPPVEVRRAIPVVPRALPVTFPVSTVSDSWQPVRLLDGTTVQAFYQGELPSSAALPSQGAVHWRRVVDRQHKLDLDKAGRAHFASSVIRKVRRFGSNKSRLSLRAYSQSGRFFLPLSERLENIQPIIRTEFLEN
jgi:hypothetical protein